MASKPNDAGAVEAGATPTDKSAGPAPAAGPLPVPADPDLALAEPDDAGRIAMVFDRGGVVRRVTPAEALAAEGRKLARRATRRDLALAGVA